MKSKNTKAMSLVEILMAVSIFTVVIAGLYSAFSVGNRSWKVYSATIMFQEETRRAFFSMVNELREAKNIFITKDSNSLTINFFKPSMGIVSYAWSNSGNNANKIVRQQDSKTRVLANNISLLSFDYPTNSAIIVDVTATITPIQGEETNFHLKGKVALRSKIYKLSDS